MRACRKGHTSDDRWRDEMAVRPPESSHPRLPCPALLARWLAGERWLAPPSPPTTSAAAEAGASHAAAGPRATRPHTVTVVPPLPQTPHMRKEHWRKSNQFFALTRAHAELVATDTEAYESWVSRGLLVVPACRAALWIASGGPWRAP